MVSAPAGRGISHAAAEAATMAMISRARSLAENRVTGTILALRIYTSKDLTDDELHGSPVLSRHPRNLPGITDFRVPSLARDSDSAF